MQIKMWYDPNIFSGNINDKDTETGLLRPKRLDNWSRAMVATCTRNVESVKSFLSSFYSTFPVRTSTRFWIIPLVSLLLAAVVEVKASTRAVVVAAAGVVLGAGVVVVFVAESPPSRPKPKRPPSGAAETTQRRGRRLSKCILEAFSTFGLATKVLKRDPRFKYI